MGLRIKSWTFLNCPVFAGNEPVLIFIPRCILSQFISKTMTRKQIKSYHLYAMFLTNLKGDYCAIICHMLFKWIQHIQFRCAVFTSSCTHHSLECLQEFKIMLTAVSFPKPRNCLSAIQVFKAVHWGVWLAIRQGWVGLARWWPSSRPSTLLMNLGRWGDLDKLITEHL